MAASNNARDEASGSNWFKWSMIAVVLAGIVIAYFFLPVSDWAKAFRDWIDGLGAAGWIAFIAVYALATLCLIPGSFLTLAAGLAYGLWGFPIVVAGATIGAGLAFLAGRYLFRECVQKAIEKRRKFKAVDSAIKSEGWKVVGLLRLSPVIPFNLQNWILGATKVRFWSYWIATFFGIMPGTLLYVWIGTLGGSAATVDGGSTAKYVLFGVGIVATLGVTMLIGRKAKAKLKEHGFEDDNSK